MGTDDITAPFQLPDILALGVAHKTSDSMRVYADATWYGWSAYDEQPITTTAGVVKSTVESNYSNTVSFALGLEKDYDNGLTTRMQVCMLTPHLPTIQIAALLTLIAIVHG